MRKFTVFLMVVFSVVLVSSTVYADVGTRKDPYPKGERFTVDGESTFEGYVKAEFELLETKRGEVAYNFLVEEDGEMLADSIMEDAKDEDKEILLAKFFMKAVELEEEPYDLSSYEFFDVMDSTGSTWNRESGRDTNNPFDGVDEVYTGGEVVGWVTFFVPEGDSPLLLVSTEGDPVFVDPEVGPEKSLVNLTLSKQTYDDLAEEAEARDLSLSEYLSQLLEE